MKFSKFLKLFLMTALVLASVLALASCEDGFKIGDYDFTDIDDHNPNYAGKSYTVTFNVDGGSGVAAQTVARGEKATAPEAPTKLGYVFSGWYYHGIRWDFDGYAVRSDITLNAKWVVDATRYTVTFDSNGGSIVPSQKVRVSTTALTPGTPEREEHHFGGWYLGETEWDFSTPITSDITLVANWIPYTYCTVTFNSAGGTEVASQTVLAGECLVAPEKPILEGNRLLGWYVGAIKWDFNTPVETDFTLTAHWKERPDNLIYDPDTKPLFFVYSDDTSVAVRDFAYDNIIPALETHIGRVDWVKYDQRVPADHEIIICKTPIEVAKRQVVVDAYAALYNLGCDGPYEKGFVIYSDGSSVAIAFHQTLDDSVALKALQYFLDNYIGEELALAPGVVYSEIIEYTPIVE